MSYLFVHFRELFTPEGEQVHFALSRDGFHWEAVNDGRPVLLSRQGDEGCRDFAVARLKDGRFVILATDLSLANHFHGKYQSDWREISRCGSQRLMLWESRDLVHWSKQRPISFEGRGFGCLWAPDILYDSKAGDYVLHWSSSHRSDGYRKKAIWYAKTADFETFTEPAVLFEWPGGRVIDSATACEDGRYYLFVKSEDSPRQILMLSADTPTGPFSEMPRFREHLTGIEEGLYEAPALYPLPDGRWCLMLDYYGVQGEGQGYVPLVSDRLKDATFRRADEAFSFPYRFKHGSVLSITEEEYERIREYNF